MKISSVLFALPLALIACGGDDGVTLTPDAEEGPDAEVQATCNATASYGAATLANQAGIYDMMTAPTQLSLVGALNADSAPDVLDIELFKGYGAYTTGEIVPGTFTITGAEANWDTCGVCVLVVSDATQSGDGGVYMASAGTVTITSVSPNLTGSISGVQLRHIDMPAGAASSDNPDGCESAITSASFDAVLMAAQ